MEEFLRDILIQDNEVYSPWYSQYFLGCGTFEKFGYPRKLRVAG